MSDDGAVEVKRVVKPAVKRIPHRNGLRMDFAPRRHPRQPQILDSSEKIVEETVEELIETTPVVASPSTPPHQVVPPGYEPASTGVEYRPKPMSRPTKSPFLPSVSVEKRPLSNAGSAHPDYEPRLPNIYSEEEPQQDAKPAKHGKKPKKTISKTEIVLPEHKKQKQSKITMILLTIATVIVGVVLGALVYFAIFKQQ